MNNKMIVWILALVLLACIANATCVVVFDKAAYQPSETIIATMVCDNKNRRKYNLYFNMDKHNCYTGN